MKKLIFSALCALVIVSLAGCRRDYKTSMRYNNQPTNFYNWSWTSQTAPWGVCDANGNEIIPRVYKKPVKFRGDYFLADSVNKQILFSLEGKRLLEAEKVDRTDLRWFLVCTDKGKQKVFDLRTNTAIGNYEQVKVFACAGQVFFLIAEKEKKGIADIKGNYLLEPQYGNFIFAVDKLKDKPVGFIIAQNENTYEKYSLDGKSLGTLTEKQVLKEKTKKGREIKEL